MIPQQLTLKNFLSYREATIDFRGLHVACVCGANGAGKSSLLEAIAWALWGQSRALTDDDVIHQGTIETLVDFTFQHHQQTYRVLRSRRRNQSSSLEFQVLTPTGFRSLTEKGIRATQQLLLQHLKLDYDTFINSAYLRQGRADEFMLKRPIDRKQILADLLKLDQYDYLAEQAKDRSRQLKVDLAAIDRNLETLAHQLQQSEGLTAEIDRLQQTLDQAQQQQQQVGDRLRQARDRQQQRQAWEQEQGWLQQQRQQVEQESHRLQQELTQAQQQQQQLESILREADAILSHYRQWQRLQLEEEAQTAKFQAHQAAQTRRQQVTQQQTEQVSALIDRQRHTEAQLEACQQQQQDIHQTLLKASEIEAGLAQLQQARVRLSALDQRQMQAAPLVQRRHQLQTQVDRAQARLIARIEELQAYKRQLEQHQQQQPHLQQQLQAVTEQIAHLEKRRSYQQQVREKGMERRTFLERLQERQRELERELAELDHKILLLQKKHVLGIDGAVELADRLESVSSADNGRSDSSWERGRSPAEPHCSEPVPQQQISLLTPSVVTLPSPAARLVAESAPSYPPCPLCDRPLDEHHWQLVLAKHQAEQQDIRDQLWVLREQLTTSDREIRLMRQEYRALEKELAEYGTVLERKGRLHQQLQVTVEEQGRLQQVVAELQEADDALHSGHYAVELQEELRLIDQSLQQLQYDDKDHALARGDVDRWRWAEIKFAEIQQSRKRQAHLASQQPLLQQTLVQIQQQLAAVTLPLQQQIAELDRQLSAIGYQLDHHTALRQAIKQAQPWQLHYQELLRAQQHYPQLQQRVRELIELCTHRAQTLQALIHQEAQLTAHLETTPDPTPEIAALEQQLQRQRQQLDDYLAQLGRLQQQQQQLELIAQQQTTLTTQRQDIQRQLRVYQELTQAFGKNGIQALMIENVLPQLEAETNQILGRLSANQLHVQFVTQRAKRSGSSDKLIDTLDILISDVQGTRPYETYSGGEAFRINFAIRLALARLLAQRSGTALQLLIIDEGFGTQDDAGCDRLIASINAISPDFACILTVTHIPHLKEAFQTRIEVRKTEQGSQVQLLV